MEPVYSLTVEVPDTSTGPNWLGKLPTIGAIADILRRVADNLEHDGLADNDKYAPDFAGAWQGVTEVDGGIPDERTRVNVTVTERFFDGVDDVSPSPLNLTLRPAAGSGADPCGAVPLPAESGTPLADALALVEQEQGNDVASADRLACLEITDVLAARELFALRALAEAVRVHQLAEQRARLASYNTTDPNHRLYVPPANRIA